MTTKKMGRPPIPNPKSEAIHIRLDSDTAQKLNAYCAKNGIPKTEAIRKGIRILLEEEQK